MSRVPPDTVDAHDPTIHICMLTAECGFLMRRVEREWLVRITLGATVTPHQCGSMNDVLETLAHHNEALGEAYARGGRAVPFDEAWTLALHEVRLHFLFVLGQDERARPGVSEQVKRQLLWAFDTRGSVNGECFLTILAHEGVTLSEPGLIELVAELAPLARRALRRELGSNN